MPPPQAADRLRDEVDAALGGRTPAAADLPRLGPATERIQRTRSGVEGWQVDRMAWSCEPASKLMQLMNPSKG